MKIDIQRVPLCLINLPERKDKLLAARGELLYFFGPDKDIHLIAGCRRKTAQEGIAAAHLKCVALAKENKWPSVVIAEDDLLFTSDNSRSYAEKCFTDVPEDFDILLSGIYHGKLNNTKELNWAKVDNFCALHFYLVNEKAYDKILKFDYSLHIDRWLGPNLKCYVTNQFWCIQRNGWSDNVNKDVNYDSYLKPYQLVI
jgi:hypothetical protein